MPDKLTDKEIVKAREVSLKEQIEHYNKRRKEVFDSYYRRNTKGNEETLEICVLRESAVLISKLESIINRLQARVEKAEKVEHFADKTIATLQAENEKLKKDKENLAYSFANAVGQKMTAKAEAYKECIGKAKSEIDSQAHSRSLEASGERFRIHKILDNLLKELVGEDK